jgi:hypothetical protein
MRDIGYVPLEVVKGDLSRCAAACGDDDAAKIPKDHGDGNWACRLGVPADRSARGAAA